MTIGAKIRSARERAGWTQQELGEKVGLTRSHISRLENGERRVQFDQVERIADVLGIPMRRLVA